MDGLGQIIENTYAAAIDAKQWPATVVALKSHFDCFIAGLYSIDLPRSATVPTRAATAIHLAGLDSQSVNVYLNDYMFDNPWTQAPALQARGMVRTDRSLDEFHNQRGYYRRTEYFNEFMKPRDFIHTLGVNLINDSDSRVKLFLYRPGRDHPFADAEADSLRWLTRHLVNAAEISRRCALHEFRVEQMSRLFDRLSFGVVLVDQQARVVEANAFARELFTARDGLYVDRGVLRATHGHSGRALTASIRTALGVCEGNRKDSPTAVRVRRQSGKPDLQLMCVPLSKRVPSPFLAPQLRVALFVTEPGHASTVPLPELIHRYQFTRSEALLAQCLASGVVLRDAADRAGIRYQTARSYLKNMFRKTDTSRQSELVSRLLSDQVRISTR